MPCSRGGTNDFVFTTNVFLFFLVYYKCDYMCALFVRYVTLSIFLGDAIFMRSSYFQVGVVSLSIRFRPTSLRLSVKTGVVNVTFVISTPYVRCLFSRGTIATGVVCVVPTIRMPRIFRRMSMFKLGVVVILSGLFRTLWYVSIFIGVVFFLLVNSPNVFRGSSVFICVSKGVLKVSSRL